jgi:hypothetical protein
LRVFQNYPNPAKDKTTITLYVPEKDEMMNYSDTPGVQGICPPGWHIPSAEEWKVLDGSVDSQFGVGDTTWDAEAWSHALSYYFSKRILFSDYRPIARSVRCIRD